MLLLENHHFCQSELSHKFSTFFPPKDKKALFSFLMLSEWIFMPGMPRGGEGNISESCEDIFQKCILGLLALNYATTLI